MSYSITKDVERRAIRYTICWSPYYQLNKHLIRRIVPSESGLYQIYQKNKRALFLRDTRRAFYGGIRNSVLELLDPLSPKADELKNEVLDEKQMFFVRFAISPHMKELEDLCYFFNGTNADTHKEILVHEKDMKKIQYW